MTSLTIDIDGVDGTGKSSSVNILRDKFPEIKFNDRGILSKLSDVYDDKLPESLPDDSHYYIILDAEPDVCVRRICKRGRPVDKYDKYPSIYKYRNRYLRLAIRYGTFYINTTKLNIEQVITSVSQIIYQIINNKITKSFILPNPDNYSEEEFNSLPLVAEGCSKIIRTVNDEFTLVSYKPTVYSHKQQREGVILFTDKERMEMTKNILYIFDSEQIPHAYIYIGKNYVLCKYLNPERDIPIVEIIVKKCFVGTDKYRYHMLDKKISRFGYPIVDDEKREYPEYIVRYDYRNPNHTYTKKNDDGTETILDVPSFMDKKTEDSLMADSAGIIMKKPKGDEVLCDDLANLFIDVNLSKKLAKKTFAVLDNHFKKMGIYFEDICFMITADGQMHYSEISQDCGRYKKIEEDKLTALDKDIFRAGGSSPLVFEKWKLMTEITKNYVKSIY
ncbi:MAG: hypothetical protein Edafosvirus27_7 [Edafosvirus sp.]|uniref:Uncharacterized protein n=1 Tax=Edafosvirus sp. TaxID=2487765 RepID=A0A3G4ZUY9_9VIRU|nr:MAG: hypothetical protein Edafosvirus27_7 [Edafosvirus sp.]